MAKKKRRVSKQRRQSSSAPAEAIAEETSSGNGRDIEGRLRSEYAYVIKDLRIIFGVAALMFVLLIVLNLLI